MSRLLAVLLAVFVALSPPCVMALDAPKTAPLLTVTGDIKVTNAGDAAQFDRALLETLDWVEIETATPFTEGAQRFAGPTLASLLDALGVSGGVLKATALNDYTIEIPVSDARAHAVLLAIEHNGKPMRPRHKGPIWIVYPVADGETLSSDHSARMIWQLNRIKVQD